MSKWRLMTRNGRGGTKNGLALSVLVLLVAGACSRATSTDDSRLGSQSSALTTEQCIYFESSGKNTICHATGSPAHPYVIVKVSDSACIHAHAQHPHDYIAINDPTCQGQGCLPVDAPCDATVPCCDGLQCQNGFCVDRCAGVTCTALDACHAAGTCDPATGQCSDPKAPDGTACDDGDACTRGDACQAGVCAGVASCGAGAHVYVVAHQDDDLLFINPDVEESILGGHPTTTVFLTAGDPGTCEVCWASRENGIFNAYAAMANVAKDWSCEPVTYPGGKIVRRCTLNTAPSVRVVFVRLPDRPAPSLASLWFPTSGPPFYDTPVSSLSAVDGSSTYTKTELVQLLASIYAELAPTRIGMLDSTFAYGDDHPDHITSALFALEAAHAYPSAHELRMFRGYNIYGNYFTIPAPEPANLTQAQYTEKVRIMVAYGGGFPLDSDYDHWCWRQYAIDKLPGGNGPIVHVNGRCLDASGSAVQAATCTGSAAQTWSMKADDTVQIGAGQCLTIGADGIAVQAAACVGSAQQRWTLMANGRAPRRRRHLPGHRARRGHGASAVLRQGARRYPVHPRRRAEVDAAVAARRALLPGPATRSSRASVAAAERQGRRGKFEGPRGKSAPSDRKFEGPRGKFEGLRGELEGLCGESALSDRKFEGPRGKSALSDRKFEGPRGKSAPSDREFEGPRGKSALSNRKFEGPRGKFEGPRGKSPLSDGKFEGPRGKSPLSDGKFEGPRGKSALSDGKFEGPRGKSALSDGKFAGPRGKSALSGGKFEGARGKRHPCGAHCEVRAVDLFDGHDRREGRHEEERERRPGDSSSGRTDRAEPRRARLRVDHALLLEDRPVALGVALPDALDLRPAEAGLELGLVNRAIVAVGDRVDDALLRRRDRVLRGALVVARLVRGRGHAAEGHGGEHGIREDGKGGDRFHGSSSASRWRRVPGFYVATARRLTGGLSFLCAARERAHHRNAPDHGG
ncbi:MAG: PIG-L family deacetylase [Minicystis sp.]